MISNQYIVTGETTTDGINVLADAVTTADAMDISADGLTTGSALRVVSGSTSTDTRDMVYLHNDSTASTGTTVLHVQNDSTGACIHVVTGGIEDAVVIESGDAGAQGAPDLVLYRNSASPEANDILGNIYFKGEDAAGNADVYAYMEGKILDKTAGGEDGEVSLWAMSAGTVGKRLSANSAAVVVNPNNEDVGFYANSDDGTKIVWTDANPGDVGGGLGFFGTTPIVRTNLAAAAMMAGSPSPTVAQLDTKVLLIANALAACGLLSIS